MHIDYHTKPPTLEDFIAAQQNQSVPAPQPQVVPPEELARIQRAHSAKRFKDEYLEGIQTYEELRTTLHDVLGTIWAAATNYHNLVGSPLPDLDIMRFMEINTPSLKASADDFFGGMPTARAAVLGYQESMGRSWK